jgi:putative transposase
LEVSSGYYAWVKRPESTRKQENKQLVELIKVIHQQRRETYGSPRIYLALQEKGINCSENRVARLMKTHKYVNLKKACCTTPTGEASMLAMIIRNYGVKLAWRVQ